MCNTAQIIIQPLNLIELVAA